MPESPTLIPSPVPTDVDAVIAWVDGADPAHRRKLQQFLHGKDAGEPAAAATRFSDCGEIDYCVASLLRFAPWLRTIFIVTDEQTPSLIARLKGTRFEQRVRVIDHREIFSGHEHFQFPLLRLRRHDRHDRHAVTFPRFPP